MHIGHVALQVPDVDQYVTFAQQAFGLRVTERSDSEALLSAGPKHHELQVLAGEAPGFDHVGLELPSEAALADLRGAVEEAGIRVEEGSEQAGIDASIRFVGPGGISYEAYTGMVREPLSFDGFARPLVRRLGHLTFLSVDHLAIEEFWGSVLGMRLSDRLGPVTWMRCDADHHGLAVGPHPEATVLHHHAWETQDFSSMGRYCDHLSELDMRLLWGPVRHGPGFNLATYLPEPTGATVEVYSDLLRILDDDSYVPVDWDGNEHALNLWGPPAPEEFLAVGVPVLGATYVG